MRLHRIIILSLITYLAGCTSLHNGHFSEAPASVNQTMALDAANRLAALYPPAHTRFTLMQPIKDAFGVSLVHLLRQKGYSVVESTPKGAIADGLALRYVVDSSKKHILHRVTLTVGTQRMSHAYVLKNGALHPIGVWVRQEWVR